MTCRYRSPAGHRRRQQAAICGQDQMWEGLVGQKTTKLFASWWLEKHPSPGTASARMRHVLETRRTEGPVDQYNTRRE
jgi:hypothetical protein